MATLAFNHQEITPRQLKPELFELDGISRESIEAHYKLYEGYVNKRNEILEKLGAVDLGAAKRTCDGKPLRPRSDNYYLSHVVSLEFYELSTRTPARS